MTLEESLKIWSQIRPIIEASINSAKHHAWLDGRDMAANYAEDYEFPIHHVAAIRDLKSPYEEEK